MNNKHLFHIVIALILSLFLVSCKQDTGLGERLPEAPGLNVLIISFDALRADALGLYGYSRETSPMLDAFATESLVFDNAYVASPVTPTSFAAAFTGLYPYKTFIGWKLAASATLATVMKDAGYQTFGLMNNVQVVAERHFDQGFDHYDTGPWKDEDLLTEAIEKIDSVSTGSNPFFGWVHFISPHTPYEYREISAHLAGPETQGRFAERVPGSFEIEREDELKRARDLYDAEIFFADHLFGQLISHLEETGVLDHTIIVVTADHGEEFMDHGQVQHNALYEELIRVPFLIRHPQNTHGGRVSEPVMNVDLLPTIVSLVGATAPENLDGVDLRESLETERHRIVVGMTNKARQEILSEQAGRKLMQICTPQYREELYDLATDPGEANNIILDQPGVANALADLLNNATGSEPCTLIENVNRGKAPEDLLSKDQIEELKSLGYIQ